MQLLCQRAPNPKPDKLPHPIVASRTWLLPDCIRHRIPLESAKVRNLIFVFSWLQLILLWGATLQVAAQDEPPPSVWTNDKGVQLEADFVRMTEDAVVLKRKLDGKEISVPLALLSIDSHYQAVKLANPTAFSKPVPKAEVKPAEPELELPKLDLNLAQMLKSPFPQETKIDQFLEILQRESEAGNFFVGWHALPPKMQTDVEEVIIKGYGFIGPAVIKQVQILLRDLNTIAQDKKEFVLGLPELASAGPVKAQIEQQWPLVASLSAGLAKEENWQEANFQPGKVPTWLANLNIALAPSILAGMEAAKTALPPGMIPSASDIKYNVISQTATSAEVEIVTGVAPPVKKSFQKVGNIWIDTQAMNELRKSIDAAKEKMAQGPPPEIGMVKTALSGVIAAVGGLARAGSQEEFNDAASLLRDMMSGLTQSAGIRAGMGGGTGGNPNPNPGGGGRPGRPRLGEQQQNG